MSTATDQVRLTERALLVPVFVEIVGQRQVTLPLLGTIADYNALLGANGVFGVKTGYTRPAGGNIVFAGTAAGRNADGDARGSGVRPARRRVLPHGAGCSVRLRPPAAGRAQLSLRPVLLIERGTSAGNVRAPWGPVSPVVTGRAVELLAAPGARPTGVLQPGRTLATVAGQPAGTLMVSLRCPTRRRPPGAGAARAAGTVVVAADPQPLTASSNDRNVAYEDFLPSALAEGRYMAAPQP